MDLEHSVKAKIFYSKKPVTYYIFYDYLLLLVLKF